MMWFFLISDALTFSGFLAAYGFMRFEMLKYGRPRRCFYTFSFFTRRTSIVICCLNDLYLNYEFVTMVLAVNAGNKNNKKGVVLWMALTIVGGITF